MGCEAGQCNNCDTITRQVANQGLKDTFSPWGKTGHAKHQPIISMSYIHCPYVQSCYIFPLSSEFYYILQIKLKFSFSSEPLSWIQIRYTLTAGLHNTKLKQHTLIITMILRIFSFLFRDISFSQFQLCTYHIFFMGRVDKIDRFINEYFICGFRSTYKERE